MCGIAGLYGKHLTNDSNPAAWLKHRGPDDCGSYRPNGDLLLEQRRLAIIDLSPLGHQPMHSRDGRACIVYNGEIYNYRELRRELERDGVVFAGHSDTEVLLNLYLKEGHAALNRLNGIFAFAIWDEARQELFVARDQLGIKPLYYTESGEQFAFASELKALLRSGYAPVTLNASAVLSHLGFLWSPGDATLVEGIKKLEPGHALTVREGRISRLWRYYDLPYDQPLLDISESEAIERVATKVEEAVQRQLVADVQVGAFLSGGLDSSAVVACAARQNPSQRVQCFTIEVNDQVFNAEGFASDLPYARRVAQHLGVDLHTVTVGPEMADRLAEMVYYLDEPTADPAALNALFISELARSQGMKVLLSGAGGDDIFTGYRRHYALMQERYWSWLPENIRGGMASAARQMSSARPALRRLGKAFQYAGLDADRRLVSYFFWSRPETAYGLLNPEFAAGLGADSLFAPLLHTLRAMPPGRDPIDQMLYLECKHFLADHNLNYTDKMGMAASVEVRVPLLDLELVELAARLPVELKQRGRTGKWVFKKAMERYLPHDVIYRPKTGFGVPLRSWLNGRLKPLVDDALSRETIHKRGIFNFEAVRKLRAADMAGQIDGTYTLFALVCMELWCRQYIDGNYAIQ